MAKTFCRDYNFVNVMPVIPKGSCINHVVNFLCIFDTPFPPL